MSTSAIGATGNYTTATATSPDRGANALTSEDFFKLLVTELRQQDPLAPSKTSDMIAQVSQIRNIELSGNLSTTLDQLAKQQRIAGATDLIGKQVVATVNDADGNPQYLGGTVTSVRFAADGTALVDLDNNNTVPLANITGVAGSAAANPAAAPASTDPKAGTQKGLFSNPVQWLQNVFTL